MGYVRYFAILMKGFVGIFMSMVGTQWLCDSVQEPQAKGQHSVFLELLCLYALTVSK